MAIIPRKNRDGSTSYQVKVRDTEKNWYPTKTFADEDLAKDYEADLKKSKRKGVVVSTDARDTSVDEFFEVWLEENQSTNSASWKSSQKQMFRDYVSPVLGRVLMADVRPPHVLRVLNRMRDPLKMKNGKARAETTISLVFATLAKMFEDAVGFYEMLPKSPVLPKHHRPEISVRQSVYLEPAQVWSLLEAARDDWAGPAVWLECLAGLRNEAALPLLGRDLLFESNQIRVCRFFKTRGGRTIHSFPKGKEPDYVPMIRPLREYLQSRQIGPDDFVCRGPNGGMLVPETYLPRLKRLCREAGVQEVSGHKLRHSCSELFVNEGATLEDLRRLLNHQSEATTRRYVHRTDERLREVAARVRKPKLRVVGGSKKFPRKFPNGNERSCAESAGTIPIAVSK